MKLTDSDKIFINEQIVNVIFPGFNTIYTNQLEYISDIKKFDIKLPSNKVINSFIAEIYVAILNREDYNYYTIIDNHVNYLNKLNNLDDKFLKDYIVQYINIQTPYMQQLLNDILSIIDNYISKYNVKDLEKLFKEHLTKENHEFD